MEGAQTQPLAHQAKAVARRASQGAATPWVCLHPRQRSLGLASSSGSINALEAV
jgi:hypothetical protein